MRFLLATTALIALMTGLAPSQLEAQDSHYWTDQMGNRAQLLGGSVIASDRNLSAVFYNPGLLGQGIDSELIITGNLFELKTLSIEEQGEPGRRLSQTKFRALPSLVAGEIFGKWLGKNRLAYSFFTRQNSELKATSRFGDELFPGLSEVDFFRDEARIDTSMTDYWGGFTWGRSLDEKHGLGVSMFVGSRNQSARLQDVQQAVFTEGGNGIKLVARDYSFYNYRLLWKIGYSTVFENWQIGATLTTPSISLFGSGSVTFDDSLVLDGRPDSSFITSDFQDGLGATFKSPLSIGFGASRVFDPWSLHFSFEWFDAIDNYTVLDPEPFEAQTSGELLEFDVQTAAKSVFNLAFGIEREFESGVRYYGSFRSDFSSADAEQENNLSITRWDLWHIGGGASFALGKTDMTLGLVYAFGTDESGPVLAGEALSLGFNRLTFILGIELPTGPSKDQG